MPAMSLRPRRRKRKRAWAKETTTTAPARRTAGANCHADQISCTGTLSPWARAAAGNASAAQLAAPRAMRERGGVKAPNI